MESQLPQVKPEPGDLIEKGVRVAEAKGKRFQSQFRWQKEWTYLLLVYLLIPEC